MPRATGVDTHLSRYEDAWEAINRLIRTGGSWSGFERNCFYQGGARGGFANLSAASGLDFIEDGRGLSVWDYDLDGDPDLVLKNRSAPQVRILRNDSQRRNGRISLRLEGTKANRQAIGARVTVRVGDVTRVKEVRAGSGFLSQNSSEIFFGVGDAPSVDVSIRWPGSKEIQTFRGWTPGYRYRVRQGADRPDRVAFRRSEAREPKTTAPSVTRSSRTARRLWLMDPAPLPRLQPVDVRGRAWDWRPFTRGPMVLSLWSPDCAVCVRELLEWQSAITESKSPLPVVAMTAAPSGRLEAPFRRATQKIRLPIALAQPEDLLALSLLVQDIAWWPRELPLPTSMLIDGQGRIVRLYEGRVSWADLTADVARIPRDSGSRLALGLPFAGRYHASDVYRNAFQLGVTYMEAGLPYRALDSFAQSLERRPFDVETYYNSGLVLLDLGDLERARDAFSAALEGQPDFVDAMVNLGVVAARQGKIPEARQHFLRVLDLRENHVEALMNLGNAELAGGDPRSAIARFRQAAKIEPSMAAAHKRIGTAQRSLGDLRAARASYEKATQLDGKDPESWSNLGVILAEAGELEAGHRACQRAISIDASYASAYNNDGLILGALGKSEAAIAAFERAIELEPLGEPAYANLAREHLRRGNTAKAKAALRSLLRKVPQSRVARDILSKIDASD